MKNSILKNHLLKTTLVMLAFVLSLVSPCFSQFKPGDGFYIIVNFVPREFKPTVDGFYRVSKEGTISLSFTDTEISVDRNIGTARENLIKAIGQHCRQKFPDRDMFPDIDLIPEAVIKAADNGVMVVGHVRRPGLIPMREGLTLFQAIQAAGGPTETSSLRFVGIVRENRTIDCNLIRVEDANTPLKPGDIVSIPVKELVPEANY